MKISMSAHIVAVLISLVVLFAITRDGDENVSYHKYSVPSIEIHSHGGIVYAKDKTISCMQLIGCDVNEVVRVLNKYEIPATPSKITSDPDCIDVPGTEPFYSMTISRSGNVEFTFRYESEISPSKLEKIATEIYWAH